MSGTKSCWNCAHKIGGEHCPMGRRKESALRAKILRVREGSESDEEAVRRLAEGKVGIRTGNGKDETAHLVDLSAEEARERIEDEGKRDPHGPYRDGPCGSWEAQRRYTPDGMMEISDMRGSDNRYRGRSSGEVSEYRRRRSGG